MILIINYNRAKLLFLSDYILFCLKFKCFSHNGEYLFVLMTIFVTINVHA